MLSDISAAEVHSLRCVGNAVALIDSACRGDAVSTVKHDAGSHAARVEREYGLVLEIHDGNSKIVKHHLGHADSVSNRVEDWLGQQHRVFLGIYFELFKDVAVDLFHVVPILNHAMLDRVTQLYKALVSFLLRVI